MTRKLLLLLIVIAALTVGCASIGNPSGGPRDEQPPRFVRSHPAPGSAGIPVRTEKITLDFDEIVNVKDPFSKVAVSPPSSQTPRISSQGRRVTVTFPDTLLPNTTYTIDFGNSIEDNNEGNPLENFSFTFSTGEYVDSLRISGFVASAANLEPMQQKLVGVHRIPDDVADAAYKLLQTDSLIFSRKFDRVARTDETGRFSIEGLSPGRYRIYALDDANSDYIYSSPSEMLAFSGEIISPTSEESTASDSIFNMRTGRLDTVLTRRRTLFLPNNIVLRTSLSRRQQQYIKKYERLDSMRLLLIMGAPMKSLPLLNVAGDSCSLYNHAVTERRAGNDSLTIWLRDPALIATDTLRVKVTYPALDSLNRYLLRSDTLRFITDRSGAKNAARLAAKAAGNDRKKKDEANDSTPAPVAVMKINFNAGARQEVNLPLSFELPQPAACIDTLMIRLEQKADTLWHAALPPGARLPLRQDTLNPRQYHLDFPWRPDTEYRLTADSLAFTSITGITTGSEELIFKSRPENEYASLRLHIPDWPAQLPAFVELLSSSEQVESSAPLQNGEVFLPYLKSGKYYLRIINDRNGNGIREDSDILEGIQAEETYYYPKAVNIKQNWNKEETWRVFDTPLDKMKPEAILRNKPTSRKRGKSTSTPVEEEEDDF